MLGFIHLGNNLDLSLAELSRFVNLDTKQIEDNFLAFNNSKFFELDYDSLGGVRASYKVIADNKADFLGFLDELDLSNNPLVHLNSNFLSSTQLQTLLSKRGEIKFKFGFKSSDFRPNRFKTAKDIFIYVLKFKDKTYFLRACFLANAKRYALRDYKKPFRSAKLGMLPPKLCQIMLNLLDDKSSVYDPFCGTGSVLMEAVLMGFKNVLASDISQENVDGTKRNLFFMHRKFGLEFDQELFVQDVTKEFNKDLKFRSVVTEGYLGKPLFGNEPENFLKAQIHTVFELYESFFKNLSKISKSGSEFVMCYPIIVNLSQESFAAFDKLMSKMPGFGFEVQDVAPSLKMQTALYKRDNQLVNRLLFKLEKQ